MPCDSTLAVVFDTSTSGRFLKLKTNKFSHNFQVYNRTEFNKTIFPFALVGYEMVVANSALRASLAITISYPTDAHGIIVNYYCQA